MPQIENPGTSPVSITDDSIMEERLRLEDVRDRLEVRPPPPPMSVDHGRTGAWIHPTAIVHPDATIDRTCEIGPYCTIDKDVVMGPHNKLVSHVVVQNHTTMGEGNIIYPFCVVGAIPQDLKFKGERADLIIGSHNVIRESVTLNLGTAFGGGVTRIGDCNLVMAYVHVAHDCVVGNHAVLVNACQLAGHVVIEDWAIVGGLTGVSQFCRVGAHSYIGGCSGVDRDVAPFTMGRGPTGNFEILGMNLVGLKRRGFDRDEILALQELRDLYFLDKSLEKEQALVRLEERLPSSAVVAQFVKFVRASKKGIYR